MENWKKTILVISILVIVIILDLFLYFKTDKLIGDIQNDLSVLEKSIEENQVEKSKKEVEELSKKWEKTQKKLSYFIEHEEIEKAGLKVAIIEENTKIENTESALEDIAEIKQLLEHIEDKYNLTLKNIF